MFLLKITSKSKANLSHQQAMLNWANHKLKCDVNISYPVH